MPSFYESWRQGKKVIVPRADTVAEGLAALPHIQIDLSKVQTNLVFFDLDDDAPITPQELTERLHKDYNILMRPYPAYVRKFRAVTHYWIRREHVEKTLAALRELLA
jgi:threonine aldolase